MNMELEAAIDRRRAKIGVIGQGYVGLPLAIGFARAGFVTLGIDINDKVIRHLAAGQSHILDVPAEHVTATVKSGFYVPTTDFAVLRTCDAVVICVPTPLRKTKDPDVSFILSAMTEVKKYCHPGMLIILESTTYPGTTDELIASEIRQLGFVVGEDIYVCFSPERVDPGNPVFKTTNTPKVIGGVTKACTRMGSLLYGSIMDRVVPVSSARVAEMVKLLENTFRAVNIGLVNELSLMCERMDIDIWEVVDAAATKPFGFMPFYPGPGIGGHCIPLDPMYLSWKAKMHDFYNKFIELASDINGNMPRHVVAKLAEVLNLIGKPLNGSRVLLLGLAYKRDVDDLRESPSLEIFHLLRAQGVQVSAYDPHVQSFLDHEQQVVECVELTAESLPEYDCVVLATNHRAFDYPWIADRARLILDTRNAFKGVERPHILRIGTATPTPLQWRRMQLEYLHTVGGAQ